MCCVGLGGVLLSRSIVIKAHGDGASFGSEGSRVQQEFLTTPA